MIKHFFTFKGKAIELIYERLRLISLIFPHIEKLVLLMPVKPER